MCLALPAKVVSLRGDGYALVEQESVSLEVSILPVPDVAVGEYVLLNLGVAVQRLTEDEAREVLDLWDQISVSLAPDIN
jgi:hydrogenase expression/formation protein HypC